MFLKQLEIIGFKSFARKTRFEFQPGLTAIVGPNGCGKSNVADAVRWVLGEQSAKALRGGSMQDVIFNGSDQQKPLNLAEVSLTLAGCEETLGTEHDEVTITRRVHRSGEGQYFINRTPCRLKDIQRLFMDTGMGTNAYAILEQGRIDQILSSRPEDRRAVFEEASGITKYKADKKEALRKLDHTEANLLRLADIIGEVKRQIISLQRQAGKARRYQAIRERLKAYDLYIARLKLAEWDEHLAALDARTRALADECGSKHSELEAAERGAEALHQEMAEIESGISGALEAAAHAREELERTQQSLRLNEERLDELRSLAERDRKDESDHRQRIEAHQADRSALEEKLQQARRRLEEAETAVREENDRYAEIEAALESSRSALQALRAEAMDLESRAAAIQNHLADIEAQARGAAVRRERLLAEQTETRKEVERCRTAQQKTAALREDRLADERKGQEKLEALRADRREREAQAAERQSALAALEAEAAGLAGRLDVLRQSGTETGFPQGARKLLEEHGIEGGPILGKLADVLQADPPYAVALEAVLRSFQDALLTRDRGTLRALLDQARETNAGSVRLVSAEEEELPETEEGPGEALLPHVRCEAPARHAVARLLFGVRVVEWREEISFPPPGQLYVTLSGLLLRPLGAAECWAPESPAVYPLTLKHREAELERSHKEAESRIQTLRAGYEENRADLEDLARREQAAAQELDACRRALALCEGEAQVIDRQAAQAAEREETIRWEMEGLSGESGPGEDRRAESTAEMERIRLRQAELRNEMQRLHEELESGENRRAERMNALSECRFRATECRQENEHLAARLPPLREQIQSLERLLQEREEGLSNYGRRMEGLEKELAAARERIAPLRETVTTQEHQLEEARARRVAKAREVASTGETLRARRAALEDAQARKSETDVQSAERRVRRQHLLDRVASEYHASEQEIREHAEPAWEDGQKPPPEALETAVAEMRARIESMGPVNLVAIEEHKELEERFAFLTHQQEDLLQAKQQLEDMIRKINKTTTALFSATFHNVDAHFQELFKQLFGGGSAKLVLVDEEDVLESGVEIIARPPGKKLQSVSLLSGGERTLTAVALLFALYKVKPSPFCVLDELDAALDESNIGRFVEALQGFLKDSQFVVITHNRQTIAAADILYGVTMERRGESSIVSVRLADHPQETR